MVTTQLELESLDCEHTPSPTNLLLSYTHISDITTTGVGCTLAKASSIIIFAYLSVTILETSRFKFLEE
jgi:hypothetical protein